MEQRVSIVTLGVADLKRARAFYDALGWKVATEEAASEIVAYNLIGMTLCLYPLDKLAEDAQVSLTPQKHAGATLAYNVADEAGVDAALEEAVAAGGQLIKPAQKVFWGGYSGYFADPDGHLWEVAYNPHAPLGKNGAFQWGGVDTA